VGAFDLRSNLPLHDELMYRWTVNHLVSGHGLKLWPQLLPLSLVQVFLSAGCSVLHIDPRWQRLTMLPFLLMTVVAVRGIARRLGADPFWALACACAGPHVLLWSG